MMIHMCKEKKGINEVTLNNLVWMERDEFTFQEK